MAKSSARWLRRRFGPGLPLTCAWLLFSHYPLRADQFNGTDILGVESGSPPEALTPAANLPGCTPVYFAPASPAAILWLTDRPPITNPSGLTVNSSGASDLIVEGQSLLLQLTGNNHTTYENVSAHVFYNPEFGSGHLISHTIYGGLRVAY